MSVAHVRHLAALSFAAALAISLAVGPAQASSAAPQMSPGTVATGGMAVAGGTMLNASGVAMPGVAVNLYAWPSDAVLQALKPGALVPTTLLATVTTN